MCPSVVQAVKGTLTKQVREIIPDASVDDVFHVFLSLAMYLLVSVGVLYQSRAMTCVTLCPLFGQGAVACHNAQAQTIRRAGSKETKSD